MSRARLISEMTTMDIFKMRRDGHSVANIARKLVIPPIRVRTILADAVSTIGAQSAALREELFALDLARLDVATKAVMPKVKEGNLPAIHTLLKVQRRRADMLGFDAPKEVALEFNTRRRPDDLRSYTTEELQEQLQILESSTNTSTEDYTDV